MEKTVAFIPVRGGSKSIPLKNIRDFCGQPLVYWVTKAASDCCLVDAVYVATDSDRIREVVEGFSLPKVRVIGRSADTANDTASTESAMLEFAAAHRCENLLLIQATSPLLETADLMRGIRKYREGQYDSLLSVVRQKRFIWREEQDIGQPVNYIPSKRPRRQEFDGFLVENGAFYITRYEAFVRSQCRLSGKIGLYEMSESSYFEIDEPTDWRIMEQLKNR